MNKILKIVSFKNSVAFVFLFVIFFNFLFFLILKQQKEDTIENQTKVSFPKYDSTGIKGFMKNFDEYFEDHLPYKYNYISFSNLLKAKVFYSLNSSNSVITGQHNWLFYNACVFDDIGMNEYTGYNNWDTKQLNKVIKNITAINNWCQKNNIKFELIICPNKHSIYSEYLPKCYTKKDKNRYDQLMESLPDLINLKEVFLNYKKKSKQLLYYKTDSHWNLFGGYLATNELFKKLKPGFPKLNNSNQISINDSLVYHGFDLANMLAIKNCYHDIYTDIHFSQNNDNKIPHLIIVHDSYLGFMGPSLNQLFTKITTRDLYSDGIPPPEYLITNKADVFVIELVERYKELLTGEIHPDYYR
jgi:hypothetical protein